MMIKSMKGIPVDIAALRDNRSATVALGNGNMNARGDILGRGGAIAKSKEQVINDYYRNNPRAATVAAPVSLKNIPADEVVMSPRQAIEALTVAPPKPVAPKRKLKDIEE